MKAFKNRLEEMAEATVNALDYSDSKVEYPDISRIPMTNLRNVNQ